MNDTTLDIRPLTPQEPLKHDEVALTPKQAETLRPMTRAQRREWLRAQERAAKKATRRALREVRALMAAKRVYAIGKPKAGE